MTAVSRVYARWLSLYATAAVILTASITLSWASGEPLKNFLRDPRSVLEGHALIGFQSNIGVLAWCCGAVTCLFTAAVLSRKQTSLPRRGFLLALGVITSVWAIDDLFLIHEALGPRVSGLGEEFFYVAYGLAMVTTLLWFRGVVLSTYYLPLVLALVFFGATTVLDSSSIVPGWRGTSRVWAEEGTKLLGILHWSGYLIITSLSTLVDHLDTSTHA